MSGKGMVLEYTPSSSRTVGLCSLGGWRLCWENPIVRRLLYSGVSAWSVWVGLAGRGNHFELVSKLLLLSFNVTVHFASENQNR